MTTNLSLTEFQLLVLIESNVVIICVAQSGPANVPTFILMATV